MRKVMLDPGHNYSGADTGAQSSGAREEVITWQIAQKIMPLLTRLGVEVRFTRPNLTDNLGGGSVSGSLNARAEQANEWGADAFVSIHCNSGGGTGVETYCYKSGGEAERLAGDIQEGMTAATGMRDRGVKTKNLAVLRRTAMPAVLAETGFIDSESDREWLCTDTGQEQLANGIARGIAQYFGLTWQETAVETGEPVYNWTLEVPEWGRPTIQKLLDKGWLKGDENGELHLTETAVRLLVINDRAGLYS